MAEEKLREREENDKLEEVWEDSSLWNEAVDSAVPELDRWDDMVKELLPQEDGPAKKPAARQEPVVDLKAVKPKAKAPAPETPPPDAEEKFAGTASDKQLLMLINKYKEAEKICETAQIPLETLQRRVGYLSYRLKKYIDVEGLYRDTGPVKMTNDGILVPKGHLVQTGFKAGDQFNVGFKDDHYIILARVQK